MIPMSDEVPLPSPSGSITERAYQRLRSDLLSCRLPPGQRVKINDLCRQLDVSPGAVREALSRLTSEGFVTATPQRGFRVAPISEQDLIDLTEARIEVELLCLRRAIEFGDVAWEARVVAAGHRISRTPQRDPSDLKRLSDDWSAAHREFHEALVSACDNQTLLQVRQKLYDQSERYRRLSVPLGESNRDLVSEHRAMQDAVVARDFKRAGEAMRSHLSETTRILLKARRDTLGESPRKESLRKASLRKESLRKASPRKASLRKESPRKESARKESPRKESLRRRQKSVRSEHWNV
jgi:DNA-binding GntR family transcriptional regulator